MTTITTRAGKGSALSWTEVDDNFNNLNDNKVETSVLSTLETTANAAATYETIANVASLSAITVTKDTSTGAVNTTNGTTAQRPTGAVAKLRYNSTEDRYESYTTKSTWGSLVDNSNVVSLGNSATSEYNSKLKSGDISTYSLTVTNGNDATMARFTSTVTEFPANLSIKNGYFVNPTETKTVNLSGSSYTFTNIPSWVQKITLTFYNVSASTATNIKVQIGNTTVQTSGYITGQTAFTPTPAIVIASITDCIFQANLSTAGSTYTGQCVITRTVLDNYVATGNGYRTTDGYSTICSGNLAVGVAITDIKILLSAGTFDAGTIDVLYE